jgi:hypothetical protein
MLTSHCSPCRREELRFDGARCCAGTSDESIGRECPGDSVRSNPWVVPMFLVLRRAIGGDDARRGRTARRRSPGECKEPRPR